MRQIVAVTVMILVLGTTAAGQQTTALKNSPVPVKAPLLSGKELYNSRSSR